MLSRVFHVWKGGGRYVHNACANVEIYLPQKVVGQEVALDQLANAVCNHVSLDKPAKPLVISAHGPPGVGKTLTHLHLAKALYNTKPDRDLECPGRGCRGYKVEVYGGVVFEGFVLANTNKECIR